MANLFLLEGLSQKQSVLEIEMIIQENVLKILNILRLKVNELDMKIDQVFLNQLMEFLVCHVIL